MYGVVIAAVYRISGTWETAAHSKSSRQNKSKSTTDFSVVNKRNIM